MINSRKKGNAFECKFAEYLRIYGYRAMTSRAESKNLDDKGVDMFTDAPFNFQLKAVEKLSPGYHDILKGMPTDKVPVIVHKRNNKGTIVAMTLEDFSNLLLFQPNEH
jgi:hypothetical protein